MHSGVDSERGVDIACHCTRALLCGGCTRQLSSKGFYKYSARVDHVKCCGLAVTGFNVRWLGLACFNDVCAGGGGDDGGGRVMAKS